MKNHTAKFRRPTGVALERLVRLPSFQSRASLRSKLAVAMIIKELPQLLYQAFGLVGRKNDTLVGATAAVHLGLKDLDVAIVSEGDVESESGRNAVVAHDEVRMEMVVKRGEITDVRITTGDPKESVFLCLGRGVLDALCLPNEELSHPAGGVRKLGTSRE